ncbi:serine/threonine-protein kinase, partial [Actinomadura sp. 7K507]|uniref:serine/threonine-protein kinase n=1 Tax=Actinomadura sp. 7K507 TaxID=2530365 RepID=UPI0010446557
GGWRAGDLIDGRYEVLEMLGQGGMGVVHRVRHLGWDAELAVKSPRPELFRGGAGHERFVAEAETWVSLGLHPHVCTCHYVRTLGSVPRVFAEYVEGGSLRDRIDDGRLHGGDPDEVMPRILDVAIQVAWGLEHAHGRGLVHQDIKPANVLLGQDGTAKITDFGLARAGEIAGSGSGAASGSTLLVEGSGGMTPVYASPEQFARRSLGRRSDMFSFGVTVLEMLTGRVAWPFGPAAATALADCLAGATGMAVPRIPPDLAALLTRCLRSEPRHRPRTMEEVSDGLTAVYEALTGRAYPRSKPRAADLRADELNNQALSLLDIGRSAEAERGFAEALAADPRHAPAAYHLGLLRWRRGDIDDDALVSNLEALRADTGDSWRARFLLAQVHMERGDLDPARELLDGVEREQPGEPEVRAASRSVRSDRLTDARCTGTRETAWCADPPPRTRLPLRLSADGRLAVSGEADGTVRLWTSNDARCLMTLPGHSGLVRSVAVSADGTRAISAGDDEMVLLWDLAQGRPAHTYTGVKYAGVSMSADGAVALYSSYDGHLQVIDTRSGRVTQKMRVRKWGSPGASISPDGRWAVTLDDEGPRDDIRVWDLATGECRHVLPLPGKTGGFGSFSTDSRFAATYTGSFPDDVIGIWDLSTGDRVRVLKGARSMGVMALSDGGRFLVSAYGARLHFWDVSSGRCVRTFIAHRGGVRDVLLSATGRAALSIGSEDGRMRRWRLPHGGHVAAPSLSRPRPHTELSDSDAAVDAMVADAERALAENRPGAALDLLTRARAVPGHEREPRVMAPWHELARRTHRTGLRAAWVSAVLTGHTRDVAAVDVGADGRLAVSGGSDRAVRLWDLDSGTCVRTLAGHRQPVTSVCLSQDGRRLLSADQQGAVRLWDVETGECLRLLTDNLSLLDPARWKQVEVHEYIGVDDPNAPNGRVDVPMEAVFGGAHARFSADGRLAVVAHADGLIRVWDLATGGEVRAIDTVDFSEEGLSATDVGVDALVVGGDGRLVASGHGGSVRRGSSVRLWDAAEGRRIGTLPMERVDGAVFRPRVTALCVSADGRLALVSDNVSWKLVLWDITTGKCLRELETETGWAFDARFITGGRFAVTAEMKGVRVWDVGSGEPLRTLDPREGNGVRCVAPSPGGGFVLAGYSDGSLRLWELDWELAVPDSP